MNNDVHCRTTRDKLLATSLQLLWTNSYGTVSVDDICKKSGVKKGSFYHFFPSKSDLAVAAFESEWQRKKAWYDEIFSPTVPPLERFSRLCKEAVKVQTSKHLEMGYVCGCPYTAIGSELCSSETIVRETAARIIANTMKYYESAIRDASARGDIPPCDPIRRAKEIYNYVIGCITHARITNDLNALNELESGVTKLLHAKE